MSEMVYQLRTLGGLICYGGHDAALLRDGAIDLENMDVEVRVRSGDYFINLASELDALSKDVTDYDTRSRIEDLVSELIYLHDNYTITKNESAK